MLAQVRRLLASPELVARTITACAGIMAADDGVLEESELIDALDALKPVWDKLYPAERTRILRLLVEGIGMRMVRVYTSAARTLGHHSAASNTGSDVARAAPPPGPPVRRRGFGCSAVADGS